MKNTTKNAKQKNNHIKDNNYIKSQKYTLDKVLYKISCFDLALKKITPNVDQEGHFSEIVVLADSILNDAKKLDKEVFEIWVLQFYIKYKKRMIY